MSQLQLDAPVDGFVREHPAELKVTRLASGTRTILGVATDAALSGAAGESWQAVMTLAPRTAASMRLIDIVIAP